jgi:fatty acid desaturase
MENKKDTQKFPIREAHHLVRDLMTPNPIIYWIDFLFHAALGWAAFVVVLSTPLFSIWQLVAFIVAILAHYRAVIFIHELAHLKKGTFKIFRLAWNLIIGIPFLVPSFTYSIHYEHHKPDTYGTSEDGEYIPFATKKPIFMVGYVLFSFFPPLLFLGRYCLLTPASYLIPPLRKFCWEKASSLTINPAYKRPSGYIRNDKYWKLQEFATSVISIIFVSCITFDVLPFMVIILWYLIGTSITILNSLRTLSAHAYRNPRDQKMEFHEQYFDSIDISGNSFITELWAPLGLRYHATHHLFMSMPYHNLGKAQRLLIKNLGDNSFHLKTTRSSMWDALCRIWGEASTSR